MSIPAHQTSKIQSAMKNPISNEMSSKHHFVVETYNLHTRTTANSGWLLANNLLDDKQQGTNKQISKNTTNATNDPRQGTSFTFSSFCDTAKDPNSVVGQKVPTTFPGDSSQKGLPPTIDASRCYARASSFPGDHRFPPLRPPSTSETFQVSSLSFADSYKAALAARSSSLGIGSLASGAYVQATRQQVNPAIFEDKEAIVTTCQPCQVQVRTGIDVSQVRKIRRKAPRLRWLAAPAARSRTATQGKGALLATSKQVKPSPAMSTPADIQGCAQTRPAPENAPPDGVGQFGGRPQVLSPPSHDSSAAKKMDNTPRDLNEAARMTTSPPDTCRTGTKATYAMEASTPNKASPAAAAAYATRPPDSGGKDERHAWEIPAPKKAGPRKDSEIFVARPPVPVTCNCRCCLRRNRCGSAACLRRLRCRHIRRRR